MTLIADFFMIAGTLAAGFYCFVLSRRLSAFKDAKSGIGQAVATLSAQVKELTSSVENARLQATTTSKGLAELTQRADGVAQRLELLVASMHDIPAAENELGTTLGDTQPKARPHPIFSTRNGRDLEA